ncbi:GNAT family N-acetyltransferase [Flagellimonas sp.]|uniref:GNAT family N-acetyltransferase n=1 Tax=Flagellimonas sp. TaxID=2058762 RepID=UPI003B50E745
MIRKATAQDYDAVWEIFHAVIRTEDTYVFPSNTPKSDLEKLWFAPNMHTYVYEERDEIMGTFFIRPNSIGSGNHIANAGYMIHPDAQGKGIGKLLGKYSLQLAKELGFTAMQYNMVVSTNQNAIKLWKKLGFKIIGTTPKGFKHKKLGLVDTYIMYKSL